MMRAAATQVWRLSITLQFAVCWNTTNACIAAAEVATTNPTASQVLPRYHLKVGQELVYRQTHQQDFRTSSDKQTDAASDRMEWRVFVAAKNHDGSWRLYIRSNIEFVNDDGSIRAKRNSLGYCDLRPEGLYAVDEQTAIVQRLIPYELFCRLPDSQAALREGWEFAAPVINYTYRLNAEDRSGRDWRISAVEKSMYSHIHQWEQSRSYLFDVVRGLVTSITSDFKDLDADKLMNRRVVELTTVRSHDDNWMDTFRIEAERYLVDFRKWLKLCIDGARSHTVDECRTARAMARAILEEGRKQATLEIVQQSYDTELQQHNEDDQGELKLAEKRSQFFAMAPEFSTDWEAKMIEGGTFRLTELRGKPVVLFFWGNNCEYCVMMGPQLNQLAAEFKEKGAALLGMFVRQDGAARDEEDDQARYLIGHAFQGLNHLDGTQVEKQYRLRELGLGHPSLVILDQAGRPCDFSSDTRPTSCSS
jgi:thiol-disulfide isomerase/thioredoxin